MRHEVQASSLCAKGSLVALTLYVAVPAQFLRAILTEAVERWTTAHHLRFTPAYTTVRLFTVAEGLNALARWVAPATGLDVVLAGGEIDAVGFNTGNGALGDVILVREEQPLFEPEIVAKGNAPADLAELLASYIIDGRFSRNTQPFIALQSTQRGRIALSNLVVRGVHGC